MSPTPTTPSATATPPAAAPTIPVYGWTGTPNPDTTVQGRNVPNSATFYANGRMASESPNDYWFGNRTAAKTELAKALNARGRELRDLYFAAARKVRGGKAS